MPDSIPTPTLLPLSTVSSHTPSSLAPVCGFCAQVARCTSVSACRPVSLLLQRSKAAPGAVLARYLVSYLLIISVRTRGRARALRAAVKFTCMTRHSSHSQHLTYGCLHSRSRSVEIVDWGEFCPLLRAGSAAPQCDTYSRGMGATTILPPEAVSIRRDSPGQSLPSHRYPCTGAQCTVSPSASDGNCDCVRNSPAHRVGGSSAEIASAGWIYQSSKACGTVLDFPHRPVLFPSILHCRSARVLRAIDWLSHSTLAPT